MKNKPKYFTRNQEEMNTYQNSNHNMIVGLNGLYFMVDLALESQQKSRYHVIDST